MLGKMRSKLVGMSAAVIVGAAVTSGANATELTLLSSWDQNFDPRLYIAERFIDIVSEASDGAISIEVRGPETVPPFNQLQPVQSGVFDLLFTHPVYHFGEKGLAVVVDAIHDSDPEKRREVGIFALIDEYYQEENNVKVLALPSAGTKGYQIIVREGLSPEGDLTGQRIRATRSYEGVVNALGGSTVVLPPDEMYSALETGVVDGAAWPTNGVLNFRWHEVAGYRVRPTFGVGTFPIYMNLEKFNSLTEAEQGILLEAGRQIEREAREEGDKALAKEEAELTKLGMEVVTLSDENAEAVQKAWAESMWKLGRECCGEVADEVRALAVEHDMAR